MQLSEQYELFRHFSVISLFHFPCFQRNFLLEVNGPSHPLQCSCLENPRDGRGSLVGCRLCGRTESDTTEVT